jgi:hypothetical protein
VAVAAAATQAGTGGTPPLPPPPLPPPVVCRRCGRQVYPLERLEPGPGQVSIFSSSPCPLSNYNYNLVHNLIDRDHVMRLARVCV